MTGNVTLTKTVKRKENTNLSYRADTARAAANVAAFFGGLLVLLTAGASDAQLTSLPDLCLRLALGGLCFAFFFAARGYAKELDRRVRRK